MFPEYERNDDQIAKFVVDAIFSDKFKDMIQSGLHRRITDELYSIAAKIELYRMFNVWPSQDMRSFAGLLCQTYTKKYGKDDLWKIYFKE